MIENINDLKTKIRGSLEFNASLAFRSWFGVAGLAEVLFVPDDIDDLSMLLKNLSTDVNIRILGALSNVLITVDVISGVVIILGNSFKDIIIDKSLLKVGAAASCSQLASKAMMSNIGGFEFLMGLPGSIGGALKMNAGCYGGEISDSLYEIEIITKNGVKQNFLRDDFIFDYRYSNIPDDFIIVSATFFGEWEPSYSVSEKTNEILKQRRSAQPVGVKCCGSAFKNPPGLKAWKLIEEAGCRDLHVGDASLSKKHSNFIVNNGKASAEDIEKLGEIIIQKVFEHSGIKLQWEIIRLVN